MSANGMRVPAAVDPGVGAGGVRAVARSERGAAGVLAIALIGVLIGTTGVAVAVAGAFGARRTAAAAADAAALAAADIASGLRTGSPCEVAEHVVAANGAQLESCGIEGVVSLVVASVPYLGLPARATARAGPPGAG